MWTRHVMRSTDIFAFFSPSTCTSAGSGSGTSQGGSCGNLLCPDHSKTSTSLCSCWNKCTTDILTVCSFHGLSLIHQTQEDNNLAMRSNFVMGLILDYTIMFMFCMTCIWEIDILKWEILLQQVQYYSYMKKLPFINITIITILDNNLTIAVVL
jgi:hypothetical protein